MTFLKGLETGLGPGECPFFYFIHSSKTALDWQRLLTFLNQDLILLIFQFCKILVPKIYHYLAMLAFPFHRNRRKKNGHLQDVLQVAIFSKGYGYPHC